VISVKPSSPKSVGWIRLAVTVARSERRLRKLWTARRSGVFFVAAFFRARAERIAGATGLVRAASAASWSSSLNSIGASFRSMWKVT
jgi:hypothetical protein